MAKKISVIVKEEINVPIENFNSIRLGLHSKYEDTIEEIEYILHSLTNNEVKFNFGIEETKSQRSQSSTVSSLDSPGKESISSQKSKRGRPKKKEEQSSDDKSLDEIPSTNRSKRAAAQAVEQKMAQMQNFMKSKKMRRPTDFDERQSTRTNVPSPPPKSRKTHRKQSAGSSHSQEADETNEIDNKEITSQTHGEICVNDVGKEEDHNPSDPCLENGCFVHIDPLTKSAMKLILRNGSIEKTSFKRKSPDMFDDNVPIVDLTNDTTTKEETKKANRKVHNKKLKNEKLVKSAEELHNLRNVDSQNLSIASDSPLTEDEFKGFDPQVVKKELLKSNILIKEVHSDSEVFYIERKEDRQQVVRKTILLSKKKDGTEVEQIELVSKKTKTDILRTKGRPKQNEEINLNEQISSNKKISGNKVNNMITSKEDIKKEIEQDEKQNKQEQFENVIESDLTSKEAVNKKSDSENESPEINIKSRTKVIKKNTENADDGCRTRTKTIRKGPQCDDNGNSKHLTPISIEVVMNEQNKKITEANIPNKGELVKKRIEDFEKMKTGVDKVEEVTGRITRHNKNKVAPSSEVKSTRVTRNANIIPKSTERGRVVVPLGSQNRLTPASDSRLLVGNKLLSSASRPTPVENSTAIVQKQGTEELERKRKEDERLKRQVKEDSAKKKKEKTLKATAEEARRKREEKLQKVAAAREAAEKEKQLLALKAEKEKEEKMLQIAAEKEKQKEEQLKKKQLAQQKALEHEERRKQDEAARLAKLREQEEEHKRILATKEREMELQKQQKATDLRLIENEKTKNLQLGGKLGKLAAANNANVKLQQSQTPQPPLSETYEMTPAREDRPLIEPKSENDYGIDDANSGDSSDEETKPKKKIPLWAQPKPRQQLLKRNCMLPKAIWPLFMDCTANPDVNQIFAGKQIKKRVRTSSAVWNTPPKYSYLSK